MNARFVCVQRIAVQRQSALSANENESLGERRQTGGSESECCAFDFHSLQQQGNSAVRRPWGRQTMNQNQAAKLILRRSGCQ